MQGRREGGREEEGLSREAEISNQTAFIWSAAFEIRWSTEMELLNFNPSNVSRDAHQITTERSARYTHAYIQSDKCTLREKNSPCATPLGG